MAMPSILGKLHYLPALLIHRLFNLPSVKLHADQRVNPCNRAHLLSKHALAQEHTIVGFFIYCVELGKPTIGKLS
jgi:hypothetical protein